MLLSVLLCIHCVLLFSHLPFFRDKLSILFVSNKRQPVKCSLQGVVTARYWYWWSGNKLWYRSALAVTSTKSSFCKTPPS
jgi:hypothetical protein